MAVGFGDVFFFGLGLGEGFDDGSGVTVAVGTSGTKGTVTLNKGDLSYTAPTSGSADAFTYTVSDQLGDTASANVSVTDRMGPDTFRVR